MAFKIPIESWHENGNTIWFYFKNSPMRNGCKKSFQVPKEIIESIQLTAVSKFKEQLKELLEP